jgi:hypothetical protein
MIGIYAPYVIFGYADLTNLIFCDRGFGARD